MMKNKNNKYEVCGVIADYHSGDALSENEKTEHNPWSHYPAA